ncbi:relaxase/mobilization nuclease domain-containing protein [Streptomyces mexicanus]|uniref:Mobilization protein n=1 Tax=Streptomyces mexicanus TaxID=178566 RepID=A0A7X1I7N5_9ACTN|nr:mobilization protein [Streptomyces mexicanus]MBC2869856.1 mobilization protein [Streptomyces mexicanus]
MLFYLYGPGKRDEHVDPHMVAAWDPYVEDPARSADMTLRDLALLLDAPVYALLGKKPPQHVYHVAVRNAPEDRTLTDAEWARVAREMMHAAGIAPHEDEQGCRWIAIRHADDHIHIVATKARQDGRQPNLRQDIVKMHAAARGFEVEFGLRRLTHGDKTARRWPKTGEAEKALRRGLTEAARETLQRAAREAAAAATSDADFFARLGAAGLRVQQRIAPDGNVTGYSVALPGDRDGKQQPVWFSGSRLAPDLSLPRVRERWQRQVAAATAEPAGVWRVAEQKVRAASEQLGAGGLRQGAGDVAALGDLIVVAAVLSPDAIRDQMRRAAVEFERAARAPVARELEGEARELYRESTQLLTQATVSVGRNDVAAVLGFLLALLAAVEASRRWHEAQEHRAQAEAAGRAGRLLHEAVEVTAGVTAAREFRRRPKRAAARAGGVRRAPLVSGERPMVGVVQQAVPEHARAVLTDPAWPALRERLVAIEQGGEDPAEVLAAVAARRELTSAESVAEVLTWRLDGWRRRSGKAADASNRGPSPQSVGGTGRASGGRPMQTPGATRRPPGDEPHRGPRRAR